MLDFSDEPNPASRQRQLAGLLGAAAGSGRIRLHTVSLMRWIATGGQLFAILFVHYSLDIRLPLLAMLPAVALVALANGALLVAYGSKARISERVSAILLGGDIVQLCYLLLLSGGLQNPFAILLLLPVTLAAATLGRVEIVVLTGLSLLGAACLALFPGQLPWRDGSLTLPPLYLLASWTALSMALILIAVFAWNSAEEVRRHAQALAATQLALAREQKLSALGGQAAAAAHLLGSPLGTINVIAKELVRELPTDSPLMVEASELLEQAHRCREILATFGRQRDDSEHQAFTTAPLSTLLEGIAEDCARPGVEFEVRLDFVDDMDEPDLVLSPELRHALTNVINNALQFAASEVLITVRPSRQGLTLVIEDDGPGFSPQILDWLGEPYVSSRRDSGGMGLGVFIAKTLLARTGAKIEFNNRIKGARVTMTWPAAAVQGLNEERAYGGPNV